MLWNQRIVSGKAQDLAAASSVQWDHYALNWHTVKWNKSVYIKQQQMCPCCFLFSYLLSTQGLFSLERLLGHEVLWPTKSANALLEFTVFGRTDLFGYKTIQLEC